MIRIALSLCITGHFTPAVRSGTRRVSDKTSKHKLNRPDRERRIVTWLFLVDSTRLWTETPETFQSQTVRALLSLAQLLTQIRRPGEDQAKSLSHSDRARCCSTVKFSFSRTRRLHLLVQISTTADGVCNSKQQGQAKRAPHAANEASNCYPTHRMGQDRARFFFFLRQVDLIGQGLGAWCIIPSLAGLDCGLGSCIVSTKKVPPHLHGLLLLVFLLLPCDSLRVEISRLPPSFRRNEPFHLFS